MDRLLIGSTIFWCMVASIRIVAILWKKNRRKKEIKDAEDNDGIVVYDAIDDIYVVSEIKKYALFIIFLWVCPISIVGLMFGRNVGTISWIVSVSTICYGYFLILKRINDRLS